MTEFDVKVLCAPSPLKVIKVQPCGTIASAFSAAGFEVGDSSISVTSPLGETLEISDLGLTFGELAIAENSLLEAARAIDGGRF